MIGPYGLTRDEYYAALAKRNGRPLTMTDPIHVRDVDDHTNTDGMTQLERVIAEALSEDRKNRGTT